MVLPFSDCRCKLGPDGESNRRVALGWGSRGWLGFVVSDSVHVEFALLRLSGVELKLQFLLSFCLSAAVVLLGMTSAFVP